jgi:diguanylate cyclase (GGDEF)-like protein
MPARESIRKHVLIGTSAGKGEERLVAWLKEAGYVSCVCCDPSNIAQTTAREIPDLVVLTESLGMSDQHRAIQKLEDDGRTRKIPVLALLRRGEDPNEPSLRRSFRIDFMTEPAGSTQFLSRVRAMLRIADDEKKPGGGGERDGLTKLYNRRYLDERIEKEIERARRYSRSVACIMVDIDNFQTINAEHGYKAGDEILKALADMLLSETRLPDTVARFGSEEFVLILPETEGAAAEGLSERLRRSFAELRLGDDEEGPGATISCGVASYPDHASDATTLIRMASSAVYQAQQEGQNCTVVAFGEKKDEEWPRVDTAATILLVEDNDYNRTVASLVLRASGYEVIEASDAATAISLARAVLPDLVIIDVNLHGVSGLEATKQLVGMSETKDIPIVALTTKDMPGDLEQLVAAGCRGYITKPIDTNNLATQIETYLHG